MSRSRRVTIAPLVFTKENQDIANTYVNAEKIQSFEKKKNHKRSMAASLKRSPSIEKIMKENKEKEPSKDSDSSLKEELEVIKRRASVISKQFLPSPPTSPRLPAPPPSPPPPGDDFYYDYSQYLHKRMLNDKIAVLGNDLVSVINQLKKVETAVKNTPILIY